MNAVITNEQIMSPDEEMAAMEELHPIVHAVAMQCEEPEDFAEGVFLPDEVLAEVHAELLEAQDELDEFVHMHFSLRCMVSTLEGQNSPSAARKLKFMLERPDLQDVFKKIQVSADPEAVRATSNEFRAFTGRPENKTAPKRNAAPPEGSVLLEKLNFPKRI